jgi:hypothetical protein
MPKDIGITVLAALYCYQSVRVPSNLRTTGR